MLQYRMGSSSSNPARLLVVEDDEQVGSGLVAGLSLEGFSVLRVPSGEEALAACSSGDYDLVLLDIGLPGIDGFDVLPPARRAARNARADAHRARCDR